MARYTKSITVCIDPVLDQTIRDTSWQCRMTVSDLVKRILTVNAVQDFARTQHTGTQQQSHLAHAGNGD